MSKRTGPGDAVQVFRLFIVLGLRLRALMDRRLADIGLTTQQAAVLTIIEVAEAPPKQGDIARVLGSSHQNVRQLLDALERKGLIEELPDEADGRACRLVTTPAVARLFASRNEADEAAIRQWLRGLTARELREVLTGLRKVAAGLPTLDDEPRVVRRRRARR
jgi:DNA-binding MarR family transcriptional regulator